MYNRVADHPGVPIAPRLAERSAVGPQLRCLTPDWRWSPVKTAPQFLEETYVRTAAHRCKHCNKSGYIAARGLCPKCYLDPSIRELYAKKKLNRNIFTELGVGLTVGRVPSYPTAALPGTVEKADVVARRVMRGEQPHHPLDARDTDSLRGVPVSHHVEENIYR